MKVFTLVVGCCAGVLLWVTVIGLYADDFEKINSKYCLYIESA